MDLHEQIDALGIKDVRKLMTLHALVECGRITELKCQYEDCRYEDRSFAHGSCARGCNPQGLVIDHTLSIKNGGTHRPDNLRVLHWGCNNHKAGTIDATEHTRNLQRETSIERWKVPEYRRQMTKALVSTVARGDDHWTKKPENREKLLAAAKKRAAKTSGDNHWTKRRQQCCG